MKLSNVKDWKTTVAGLVAGLIMVAGIAWPDKVNPDTQEVLNTATGQIISGIGAIIGVIVAAMAKDN